MTYDPRTIAFHAELLIPPVQLQAQVVQGIHNKLFTRPEISYQNFQVAQDGIHLTNLATSPGMISSATFLPDRIVLREEFRATTAEDFSTRIVNVAKIAFEDLAIQTTIAQQFVVRSLISPRHVATSQEFLLQRVPGSGAGFEFERPLASVGYRMVFPATPTQSESMQLRIESWNQDPRSLWIENTAQWASQTPVADLPRVGAQLFSTYRFITGPVAEFIGRHDQPFS